MKPKQQLQNLGRTLKRWVEHDWEAKLVALVLAFLVWYIVKDQVARGRSDVWDRRAAAKI